MKQILFLCSLIFYSSTIYACEANTLITSWGIRDSLEGERHIKEVYSAFTEQISENDRDSELLSRLFQRNYQDFQRISVQYGFSGEDLSTKFIEEICNSFSRDEMQKLLVIEKILNMGGLRSEEDKLFLKNYRDSALMKKERGVREKLLEILVSSFSQALIIFVDHLNRKYSDCSFRTIKTDDKNLKVRVLCG